MTSFEEIHSSTYFKPPNPSNLDKSEQYEVKCLIKDYRKVFKFLGIRSYD